MSNDTIAAVWRIATWVLSLWTGIALFERCLARVGSPRFSRLRTGSRFARGLFSLPGLLVAAGLAVGAHYAREEAEIRALDQSDLSGIDVTSAASLFPRDIARKKAPQGQKVSRVDAGAGSTLMRRYGDDGETRADCSAPAAPSEAVR